MGCEGLGRELQKPRGKVHFCIFAYVSSRVCGNQFGSLTGLQQIKDWVTEKKNFVLT